MMITAGLFLLAALALFGVASLLMRNTTARSRVGGAAYEKRRKRLVLGRVVQVSGCILLAVAALTFFYAEDGFQDAPIPPMSSDMAPALATPPPSSPPVSSTAPSNAAPTPEAIASGVQLFNQAQQLLAKNNVNDAMDKLSASIAADPTVATVYAMRGSLYAQQGHWLDAEKDGQTSIRLDPHNTQYKFNLAQLNFMQKKYSAARSGFDGLQKDPDLGDLCSYKVFLCDLLNGRGATAARELDAFNQVGGNASYYFANLANALYLKKLDEARTWEVSARRIYPPQKFDLYARDLSGLAKAAKASAQSTPGTPAPAPPNP